MAFKDSYGSKTNKYLFLNNSSVQQHQSSCNFCGHLELVPHQMEGSGN